ncbi:MAG: recombinase family protein [Hyphomicrobium sp.]|nr:recombinase family protein [Hyphomicrobium sp.]
MIVGYARVSTDGQSLDAQLDELKQAGCERVFQEKISGTRSDRQELAKVMAKLDEGDILIVSRLDRLARSSRDLLNILHEVAAKRVTFRSIHDVWADTSTAHGQLMVTVLAGLAEFERSLIRARTSEGRARAMRDGVRFGRKPKLTAHQRQEALRRRENGETTTALARSFNVSHSTICRLKGQPSKQTIEVNL